MTRTLLLVPLLPSIALAADGPDYSKMKTDQVFEQLCASCHGKDLSGGLGGSLIDGEWKHGGSDQDLLKSIREGNAQFGMTAFKTVLDDRQIRSLVIHIREKEKQAKEKGIAFPKPELGKVTKTQHEDYKIEMVVEEGLKNPWAIAFLPDGRKLVTEKAGRLRIIDATGKLLPEPVKGTPKVIDHGQGGLMEVAVHPDYEKNGWIYLGYSDGSREGKDVKTLTTYVRGKLKDGEWTGQELIWKADPKFYSGAGVHFGTRLVFDKGYVYFPVGERGGWMEAQDVENPKGKMIRLHDDGRVPADNPKFDGKTPVPGLWSYGHRNPQGLDIDPRDGSIWSTEHGPRGGDELNLVKKGLNYGWPVITYGMNYNGTAMTDLTAKEGMEQPLTYWVPSIAPCGADFYTGDLFPNWKNHLFIATLAAEELHRIELVGGKVVAQEVVFKGLGRIRDVVSGPDGALYVLLPNRIARVAPAP
jgi:glucose/arabinose dehydrogenase